MNDGFLTVSSTCAVVEAVGRGAGAAGVAGAAAPAADAAAALADASSDLMSQALGGNPSDDENELMTSS